jgi:hypothetical protein
MGVYHVLLLWLLFYHHVLLAFLIPLQYDYILQDVPHLL